MTSAPVLTILDGMQSGARMRLVDGDTPIGSGVDCAVVVADPAMQARHFVVLVNGHDTLLRALRPLTLPDGRVLIAGEELVVASPTIFSAGDTRFLLDVPIAELVAANDVERIETPSRFRPVHALAASVAVLLACAGVLLSRGLMPQPAPRMARVLAPSVAPAPMAPKTVDLAAATTALRHRLGEAGLQGVTVARSGDGTLLAGGVLLPSDQPAWEAVRQWFDARYGSGAVIVERFAAPGSMPPLKIAAVWTGKDPYVVNDVGDRMHVGAAISDGWFVERIAADRVTVRRGSQHVELRF